MATQITNLTIVYSAVYSGADQRKHQSSTSLAFLRGIHRGPVNSPHKWPVTRKMFPFDDVIMYHPRMFPLFAATITTDERVIQRGVIKMTIPIGLIEVNSSQYGFISVLHLSSPITWFLKHYNDVIMSAMASQIPASRLFTQPFIRAQIKENTKAPLHWTLCGEFTGYRWIPRTKGQ